MGWHNIAAGDGIGIAIVGMSVVFIGLLLIVFYISSIPRIFERMDRAKHARASGAKTAVRVAAPAPVDDLVLMAAIGYVLQAELEHEQAQDYQRITIQRDESQQVWSVAGKMRTLSTRL